MDFDASIRRRWTATADAWTMELPTGWLQGRSVFGGLVATAAVSLAVSQVDPARSLRTLSVQLFRPVAAGALKGRCRILREGKSVTFVEVRLAQGGQEVAVVSLVFVIPRAGSVEVEDPPIAGLPSSADELMELPYIPNVTPEFIQHVAMRWASGEFPFSGQATPKLEGYCRFRGEAGDVEGVVGLLDVWPCPSLSMLSAPAFASTVSWTAHIRRVPASFDGWFAFAYETVTGADGFHTAVGRLYAPDGTLVGWTEQLVALFD